MIVGTITKSIELGSFFFLLISLCLVLWVVLKKDGTSIQTSFDLPIVLLILLPSSVGLYASPDVETSMVYLLQLVVSAGFFYVLVNWLRSESRVNEAVMVFMYTGIGVVLASLLVMQKLPTKLPGISQIFAHIPNVLPRPVHPNYIAGVLGFFLFWTGWHRF